MPEPLAPALLAELVRSHVPLGASELRLTAIATGEHNSSYRVEGRPTPLVLRVAPPDDTGLLFYERRMMRQEPELHALVRARTTIPVAEVVAFDFGRSRLDRDYLLMTALPGEPLSSANRLGTARRPDLLRQLGAYLRQLHALTAADCFGELAYGYLGAHHPMTPQPSWAAAFEVMWDLLLDDVVASGCYTPAEADELRLLLDRHRAHFDRVVPASLLHMDVWEQNVLVDGDGRISGLVDFDRALWGDPEIEFAVLDYCGLSDPPFWSGYGRERDPSPSAEVRRQFYLLYELQKYMPIAVWRRHDCDRAAAYRRECRRLAARLARER